MLRESERSSPKRRLSAVSSAARDASPEGRTLFNAPVMSAAHATETAAPLTVADETPGRKSEWQVWARAM